MKKRIQRISLICLTIILNIVNVVYAANEELYNGIYRINFTKGFVGAGVYIAGWIQYFAIIICVIVLMTKGIKFITSSPEGKADAKKELIPWFIGLVLLFTLRIFLNWLLPIITDPINELTPESVGFIQSIINA